MQSTLHTRSRMCFPAMPRSIASPKAGLQGLTMFLAQRTALRRPAIRRRRPGRDELAFFPIIYWAIVPSAPKPPREALETHRRLYEAGWHGCCSIRVTPSKPPARPGGAARSPGMLALRNILSSLDIPELEPVPKDTC